MYTFVVLVRTASGECVWDYLKINYMDSGSFNEETCQPVQWFVSLKWKSMNS